MQVSDWGFVCVCVCARTLAGVRRRGLAITELVQRAALGKKKCERERDGGRTSAGCKRGKVNEGGTRRYNEYDERRERRCQPVNAARG